MGCADYRLYCDGDSDSDGNDLMHGVLNKEKRSGINFQSVLYIPLYKWVILWIYK